MKKSILAVIAIFSFAVLFTACKETKKEEVKEEIQMESHEGHNHDSEMASTAYQCPMDCEKGKTYEGEGSCPVCKMDLKENAPVFEHAEGCKCTEAGECTCEDGKCSCKEEVASNKMECTKCEPGSCECKA